MIAALAKAGSVLDEPTYLDVATKAADFILNQMRQGDVLYHRYAKGEAAVEGFLDDYAFFVFGLIELYEATFEDKYLQAATDLTKTMIEKFWDIKMEDSTNHKTRKHPCLKSSNSTTEQRPQATQ